MRKLYLALLALAAVVMLGACGSISSPDKMAGTFTVHKVYGDHMVLQCDRPIRISGTAAPGESVKVTIGDNSAYATAGDDGEWTAELPAMKAGMQPYSVVVTGKEGTPGVSFEDVLIGEVWLASGQSNMEMPVYSGRQFWNSANGKAEVAAADHPGIRLYNTNQRRSVSPGVEQKEIAGPGWVVCSPETVGPFSALGYYFARQLHKDLNVPVGVINSSWGGTPIQSWISEAGYRSANRPGELAKIESSRKPSKEQEAKIAALKKKAKIAFDAWEKRFYAFDPAATAAAQAWKNPGFDDSGWQSEEVPSSPAADFDGIFWYRRTVTIPAEWAGKELTLSLGAIDDCDETFFNGEKVGATGTSTPNYWSVPRVYKIPGKLVKAGANTIAVRVADMYSNGGMAGPEPLFYLQLGNDKNDRIRLNGAWKYKVEFKIDTQKLGTRPTPPNDLSLTQNHPYFPATLYNSMIAPWTVYPIRGVIWYQGESNAGAYEEYMKLHPLLIQDWRNKWNNPEMPFLFIQLAAFERHSPAKPGPADFWKNRQPSDSSWPKLREVQTATLAIPNTGMAVAIDVGNPFDIHPADKQTLGYRLGKEAERICYGSREISAGPLYERMTVEGNKVRLFFKNTGSGLVARDGAPTSFAIAGKDGNFVWADAKIDGDTVLVWSDKVKEPVEVRYAWAGYPGNANLYNKEGFPASPFRTAKPDYLLK
ncbi:sialate O-acetylesterase [Victivallis vadensis]|uniref:Sialate O-acetylesterase n=1 Tax=Victivallis vadensis TaxID=172901 RepID=A0A2U1BBM2_9BACT|nr:sialate O-acetylesterase [Victivallis vadensis]PVY46056.1 sialate O-acetylesterase [Victivallis vadensis]